MAELMAAPVISPAPLMEPVVEKVVHVTPKAVGKIRVAFAKQGVSGGGLRLGVLGGGCSGLSYQFKYDAKPRATDHVFTFDDIQVYVDPKSMIYLSGMTLDWKDSLIQSGFVFDNPHAEKNCGCGTSFSA
ncbi:MAG: iron-sulfur cluster assembly accessory protein [Acidobacteria bacterium]|nr:iron-sulfur cluster assembly accessory protein [Acidobacteriota bacterium]